VFLWMLYHLRYF